MNVNQLKGIGEKTEKLFWKVGLYTTQDLVKNYPIKYDVFWPCVLLEEADENEVCAVRGIVDSMPLVRRGRGKLVVSVTARDARQQVLHLAWFHMPYLQKTLQPGMELVFRGRLVRKGRQYAMDQPQMFSPEQYQQKQKTMQPVYRLTKGLTNTMVSKATAQALQMVNLKEYWPRGMRKQNQLMEYSQAVHAIHFPETMEEFFQARDRLVFDEFFFFIYTLSRLRREGIHQENRFRLKDAPNSKRILEELPYELTGAQKRVWGEICQDLSGDGVMNRLIQGDVGSGKTILAVLAMVAAADQGWQSALMAPTEVLARQHYEGICQLFREYGISYQPVLLTGSVKGKERRDIYERIATGQADLIIGTHAVIQEAVIYHQLALVITDEQHRFGVRQRERLSGKGEGVHTMVMSATPIPRTLAIILYGDLDISVVDELPASRLPIKNCVVGPQYRPRAFQFLEEEIQKGHQGYLICPMIEEGEQAEVQNVMDYTQLVQQGIPHYQVACLHGKMKPEEKNEIMERFAKNEIQILVSTTVVEVGINVPNATVMMIEDAQKFGLATLHQLRGRVGRGEAQSYCIFVCTTKKQEAKERLDILNHSNDGFQIAQEDLKTRGPGDLFGIRQSGDLGFVLGDIFTDSKMLTAASQALSSYEKGQLEFEEGEQKRMETMLARQSEICAQSLSL